MKYLHGIHEIITQKAALPSCIFNKWYGFKNRLYIITIVLSVFGGVAQGQIQSSEVISSQGGHFSNTILQISYVVGQTVANTLSSGSFIISQGFLQGELPEEINILDIPEDISNSIIVYPNPASDYIQIDLSAHDEQSFSVEIFDMKGNITTRETIDNRFGNQSKLDFSTHKLGVYIIRVLSEDKQKQGILKVIKVR